MRSPQPRPRVVACIDNRVGYEVLRYLTTEADADVRAVVVHPEKTALFGAEIRALARESHVPCFDVHAARSDFDELLGASAPDFLVSIYFDYILDSRFLNLPRVDAINLHPGYLPFNRGFYYYVWAVLDGTPAGVSLHRMAPEVDAGELIAQARVAVDVADTGETLYRKHEDESIRLFRAAWPSVVASTYKRYPQLHRGTHHKIQETMSLARIDPNQSMTLRELIDRLRVFTFPGKSGCTVELDGRTFQINLTLDKVATGSAAVIPGRVVAG